MPQCILRAVEPERFSPELTPLNKLWAVLKSTAGELVVGALVIGMVYMILQLFNQRAIFQEITPDPGMTKHCTQDSEGAVVCSQAPKPPPAPAAAADPDAPLFVTVTVGE